MVERKLYMPPPWCSGICQNAMQDVCVEICAPTRDCSHFEPKRGLTLEEMPRFPINGWQEMTRLEKTTAFAIYLSKVVDYLQGVENERANIYYTRSRKVPETVKVESILPGTKTENTICKNRKERENKGDGFK